MVWLDASLAATRIQEALKREFACGLLPNAMDEQLMTRE